MPLPGLGLWDGNLVSHQFYTASLAASQTNALVLRAPNGSTTISDYKAFGGGYVVGIQADIDAQVITGTATFQATINGNAVPLSVLVSATSERATYSPMTKFKSSFKAGDLLGVKVTTSAGWTAANVFCSLLVGYDRVCASF